MKISQIFGLDKTQYELDFVDINVDRDTPLFLDPYYISVRNDSWSVNATRTIQSFFQHIITLINAGSADEARGTFDHLGEPNETCLGLSKGLPGGRGIGDVQASAIFDSILGSHAVQSGLVEDLEDCRLFVEGIDKDKISDMTTNIIRGQLIEYTQQQAELYGIPLQQGVVSGFFWNRNNRQWENSHTKMLLVGSRTILLVPKSAVSYSTHYSSYQYHQHFVLNFLKHEHLRMGSALVKWRRPKKGAETPYVNKIDIKETEAPLTKEYLRTFTLAHPAVFAEFRDQVRGKIKTVTNSDLTDVELGEVVGYLLEHLNAIPTGRDAATAYHRLMVGILELVFFPQLTCPQVERKINEGRKRIDITFDNAADKGFFFRIHQTHQLPASFIMVECKNYDGDPRNPELDQLAGRFAANRGRVGLLVCRRIKDMELFQARCRDTYRAGNGLIIPLIDVDFTGALKGLLEDNKVDVMDSLLLNRFREIALG